MARPASAMAWRAALRANCTERSSLAKPGGWGKSVTGAASWVVWPLGLTSLTAVWTWRRLVQVVWAVRPRGVSNPRPVTQTSGTAMVSGRRDGAGGFGAAPPRRHTTDKRLCIVRELEYCYVITL